ncbi:bifunctional DNA primase/polymerase-like protein [Leucobacter komagatae]|uniref:Bifunctional DNA primase/polymerase-like protein n=2 Tax=Leucobacter komagatae TaxID=55969 RepID=A0A542Y3F5_9MICO|nr:bifunctional DNA primase/polymerase-like protein [Leucobacter komagatae]
MAPVFDFLARAQQLSLADAARMLAESGVPVFPCMPGEKRPLTRRGFHDASTNPKQVSAWWRRWPAANLAIPTGPASGIEVVDVDVGSTGSGFPAFQGARREGLVDGWAALVRTPSGGLHAYFPADESREQASWQAPTAHIDFRGSGGYILAPPSRVLQSDGQLRPYELRSTGLVESGPVDAGRLRNFLDPRPPVPHGKGTSHTRSRDVQRLGRWVAALGKGERNRGLFWAACRLAEHHTPVADTLAVLGPAAEHAGLGAREIATTIRSAYRATDPAAREPAGSDPPPFRGSVPQQSLGRVIA